MPSYQPTAALLLADVAERRLLRSTALFCIHWWRKTEFSLIIQSYSVMKDTAMYDNLKSLGITNPEIDRYSLRQEANNDILKIYFQKDREVNSLL